MNTIMLHTFVVAASTGSLSEAAKKLRYGRSTVAYHIREVEKACRAELFEREVHGLSLTRSGQIALKISQQLLQMTAELKSLPTAKMADRPDGRHFNVGGNVVSHTKTRQSS